METFCSVQLYCFENVNLFWEKSVLLVVVSLFINSQKNVKTQLQENVKRSRFRNSIAASTGSLSMILHYIPVRCVSSDQILCLLFVCINISNLYKKTFQRSSLGTIITALTGDLFMSYGYYCTS